MPEQVEADMMIEAKRNVEMFRATIRGKVWSHMVKEVEAARYSNLKCRNATWPTKLKLKLFFLNVSVSQVQAPHFSLGVWRQKRKAKAQLNFAKWLDKLTSHLHGKSNCMITLNSLKNSHETPLLALHY